MAAGLISGFLWAVETVLLGLALAKGVFHSTPEAIFLAPFVSTFLHDCGSTICITVYNLLTGHLVSSVRLLLQREGRVIALAAIIGGPLGMTGYTIAINNLGASAGAVATAVYPAIGTVLARIFLKEQMKWYQWGFLLLALLGVYGLSYSPELVIRNFWLGIIGAVICAVGWGLLSVIMAACLKDASFSNVEALEIKHLTSALVLGVLVLPLVRGWTFTGTLFHGNASLLLLLFAAGCMATLSYLYAFRSLQQVGASRFMAANITYTAWAILITAFVLGDRSVLTPLTVVCAVDVMVCGFCAATDVRQLFKG
ncbi:MAG: DMT family transporter [Mogibacterium sp.]|nr:DMT family transporter [Mogibacterium sp.]